jgi:TRAP-type uncharacterized transport system substrate-binding protein
MRLRELHGRDLWLVAVPSVLLVLVVLYFALRLTEPLPPNRIVIVTAAKGSGYAIAAERYKERLAREGVALEIRYSGGSAENLALLRDPKSGVDAAFTTVGGKLPLDDQILGSLGGMFPSAVLVLYRGNDTITRFRDFNGLRVSIGGTGTVIRSLMMRLLQASGVVEGTTIVDLTAEDAFKALLTGKVDAMIIPSPLEAPLVRQALRTPGVRLMNVAQAEAIARRMPELRHVVLPRGGIDLAADEPPEDVHLLASTNSLVVRRELHPALQLLLLDVASEFHSAPGLFNRFGEYLGFRISALTDRLTAILLPLLAILIPVLGYAPPMYRWLNRRRIWRWHGELLQVEAALEGPLTAEEHAELSNQLAAVDAGIAGIKVGRPFLNEVYHLRNHSVAVRDKLAATKISAPEK